jgi:hypothetical protein
VSIARRQLALRLGGEQRKCLAGQLLRSQCHALLHVGSQECLHCGGRMPARGKVEHEPGALLVRRSGREVRRLQREASRLARGLQHWPGFATQCMSAPMSS